MPAMLHTGPELQATIAALEAEALDSLECEGPDCERPATQVMSCRQHPEQYWLLCQFHVDQARRQVAAAVSAWSHSHCLFCDDVGAVLEDIYEVVAINRGGVRACTLTRN